MNDLTPIDVIVVIATTLVKQMYTQSGHSTNIAVLVKTNIMKEISDSPWSYHVSSIFEKIKFVCS